MPEVPTWVTRLAETVAAHIIPTEPQAPVGCNCRFEDGVWEVNLFASSAPRGASGAQNGASSRFIVDVMPLLRQFGEVLDCTWQPERFGADDELGSHLSIIGTHAGKLVCLRVLSREPG